MIDNNNYLWPSINGSDQVEKDELEMAKELSFRYTLLDRLKIYNSGNGTTILSSGANGYGEFDPFTSGEHRFAARRLMGALGKIGCSDVSLVVDAGISDLEEAILDSSVASIFLLGHGTYHSWVATDGAVDWYQAGKMVGGHLKDGVFANLGCGGVHSWNFIPLGRYVVGSQGVLLGKSKELTALSEMSDLSKFSILK